MHLLAVLLLALLNPAVTGRDQNRDPHFTGFKSSSFVFGSGGEPDQSAAKTVRVESLPPKDSYDRATFWTNLALAVVGVVGIRVALRSVRAAERSAFSAERGLIQVQRAFVYKDALKHVEIFDPRTNLPYAWRLSVLWKNSGSTPALKTITHLNIRIRPEKLPTDFDFTDYDELGRVPSYLGPGAEVYSTEFNLSLAEMNEIRSGTKLCYVWGWYEYFDVFGETDRHRSEYCFQLMVLGDPFPAKAYFIERNFPLHNGADGYSFHGPKTRGAVRKQQRG